MKNFPSAREKFQTRGRYHQRPLKAPPGTPPGAEGQHSGLQRSPKRRSDHDCDHGWPYKIGWLVALLCMVGMIGVLLIILLQTKPVTFSDISMFFHDYL